ncbi:MAG: GNAT family N-acetyltransferase [Phascolarctobacterium sp.]|nr:GNAT family N-acetyltransferase [Phascolarctobacterium sp.]
MNVDNFRIRNATLSDIDTLANVEAQCFPVKEAATRESIAERVKFYPEGFWLLFDGEKLISFVDGLVTDNPNLEDIMYEQAAMHQPNGAWQMIFGVNTIPDYRKKGCAAKLINAVIENARKNKRKGVVLTCKEKLLHYYSQFGFVNEGISDSTHGDVLWYQMRLTFK